MSLAIHSLSTYLSGLSYRISAANALSFIRETRDLTNQAVEDIASHQNTDLSAQALQAALSIFTDKTRAIYGSFQNFEFPEGDLPEYFRTTSVSDPTKLIAQATSNATPTSYLIHIDRLAAAQTNRSKVLVSGDITDLAEGTYTFTLTVGDRAYSLSLDVDKSGLHPDTNKDVLEGLGRAIRHADDSLEAFVTQTQRNAHSTLSDTMTEKVAYLTIRNKNMGSSTSFSLSDETGTIIDTLGVGRVSQSAEASLYRLNGVISNTEMNTATADNGQLTLTFLDPAHDPVKIMVKSGLDPVKEKVMGLIFTFNEYIDWLDQNSEYLKPSVKATILKEMQSTSSSLRTIGLHVGGNGKIYLGKDFTIFLEGDIGMIRESLTGENGFFSQMATTLKEILDSGVQNYGISIEESGVDILI